MNHIRPARRDDAQIIQEIYTACVPVDVAGLTYEVSDWPLYVGVAHVHLLIAETKEGEVVGFLLGYDLVNWGYIDILVVRHSARGKGAGAALIASFEKRAEGRWVASELAVDPEDVELWVFLKGRGYTKAGTTEWCVHDLSGEVPRRRKRQSE